MSTLFHLNLPFSCFFFHFFVQRNQSKKSTQKFLLKIGPKFQWCKQFFTIFFPKNGPTITQKKPHKIGPKNRSKKLALKIGAKHCFKKLVQNIGPNRISKNCLKKLVLKLGPKNCFNKWFKNRSKNLSKGSGQKLF